MISREKADAIKSMEENHMKDNEHQQQRFQVEWQQQEKETGQYYQQIEFV